MTIEDIASVFGRRLEIVRQPNSALGNPWQAHINGAEVKDGAILTRTYGTGTTPMEALNHYCTLIAGKTLVFDAYRDSRLEINVPHDLSVATARDAVQS